METPPSSRVPPVLLGSLMVTGIGQTLLYALLPLASRRLGISGFQSSTIFALSSLLWSLSSPVWGRMSDRSHSAFQLTIGMCGQAASNLAVGLTILLALRGRIAPGLVVPLLLLLRGINGVLGSAVLPSAQGLALRSAPARPRIAVIGMIATSWTIGTMTGPGFAALLAPAGLAAPLFAAAILSATAGLIVLRLPVADRVVAAAAPRPHALRFIRRRIWPLMIMQLGNGTANSIVAQSTGFFAQDRLGLAPHAAIAVAGTALSVLAASSVAMQVVAVRLRPPPRAMMLGGSLAVALAGACLVTWPAPAVMIACLAAMGAGFGAATLGVSTTASLITRANQQGGVAGSLASASSIGALVSALMIMPFYDRAPDVPYLATAALGLAVCAGALISGRAQGGAQSGARSG